MTRSPASTNAGPGEWVADRLGARLLDRGGVEPVQSLVQLGLRRNPRRAHLLVSGLLGKHVPADPGDVYAAGVRLARLVAPRASGSVCVIGYAETATGLGHVVAETLNAYYLHSTRRRVHGVEDFVSFDEEHSHAVAHRLLPERAEPLMTADTIVLVDDEFSTGRTAMNTIAALRARGVDAAYVIASLVDVRCDEDESTLRAFASELGVVVHVESLSAGRLVLPEDFVDAASLSASDDIMEATGGTWPCTPASRTLWPIGVREGGRHGFGTADVAAARRAARDCATSVLPHLAGPDVLVLGTEELMYAPLVIARQLRGLVGDRARVRLSSTTRSPVVTLDEHGYPVRSRLTFAAPEDRRDTRFAYNVAPFGGRNAFSDVVVVVDEAADTDALHGANGLLAAVNGVTARVHLVVVPTYRPLPEALRGPAFGSYRADEVGWLLTDISDAELERPTEEREDAIQSGGAHYSESLPIEYQPTPEYLDLFAQCLHENAARVAMAVGVLTEIMLDERGEQVVLASLARAGTPVGILVRRWAQLSHGTDLPHYSVSIVRGRGIDDNALRYLATHHPPSDVVFLDGWTGKGAIARELLAAIPHCNERFGTDFVADLAVLADTGHCVSTFGTRADFLIPSACLNSTVSGLVSRTVLNRDVLDEDQYHGAKFYRSLAPVDVSARFLDAVAAQFDSVRPTVERTWRQVQAADREPDWSGWAAVEAIARRHGVTDLNLIKPGVGETTRVLLRRVPWRVLVRPQARPELRHVLMLAADRGAQVVDAPELPFDCVGLIRPGGAAR